MNNTNDCEKISKELGFLEFFCIASSNLIRSELLVLLTLANGKKEGKNCSTTKMEKNNKSINNLLFFIVYCAIFFCFLIIIWNISYEYLNLTIFYFGIIIIAIIFFYFLIKKERGI